ncbi:type II secretion system F family protein [Candidatus Saganbacteria bacterium]|uniref:Type II secretion system F family protein n=1 Tax=Candidatus Saganbacteria bacterium TaxID=2575572 RepID=A0A9D6UPB4_UNCSA|nr:type II secretion system F family protein [Candidatus Saganbacteria bacterium]
MTSFSYKARDRYGVLTSGSVEAENSKVAALQLTKMGFTPIQISTIDSTGILLKAEEWFRSLQKLKAEELIVFTRQLSSVLDAGVPLLDGLGAVAEQITDKRFRAAVLSVKREIEGGATFSNALNKHPKMFSTLIVNMIKAGEKAGILPEVLDRLSALLEKDLDTRSKITAATRYPLIVFGVLCVAFVVMSVYVIPKFASFFAAFKADLPLPTRILMKINYVISNYWYWIVGIIALAVYSFRRFVETEKGRYQWDHFTLSTPIFGSLFSKVNLSRFGRMLSAMLGAGIPILEALVVTAGTIENKVISRVILDVRDQVSQGKSLTEPMKGSRVFPPIAISMVAIGEKAGSLEKMLSKVADYFDREADYIIKNLTPLLEPIMILGLALLMLLFALGVFLPMWDIVKIFKT